MGNVSASNANAQPACAAHPVGLASPTRNFYSQRFQDWAVAGVLHAAGKLKFNRTGSPPLVYVDLATNDAQIFSNTFFFDRCLHARGLCIEPNPAYHAKIKKMR